jgi:hypothetical protein
MMSQKNEIENLARELVGLRKDGNNINQKFEEYLKMHVNLRDFDREVFVKRRALEMSGTAGELGVKRLEITIKQLEETREIVNVLEHKLGNFLHGMRIAKGYKPAEVPFHDLSIEAVNLSLSIIREKLGRIDAYVNSHKTESEYIKEKELEDKKRVELEYK